jgi:predicted ATPase
MRRIELEEISIRNFKSIQLLEGFRPGPLNIFIGANGAGKSNFISFFRLMANMLSGAGNLREFTARNGGASRLIFEGDTERQVSATLCLKTPSGLNEYKFGISQAAGDAFFFNEEQFRFSPADGKGHRDWNALGSGHTEAALVGIETGGTTQDALKLVLKSLVSYQFHNTTFSSPIRNHKALVENHWFMAEDGRNLAAVLLQLSQKEIAIYQKIILLLQQIIPFFEDFALQDEYGSVYLRWKERASPMTFGATEASDGMLRAMALVTLLCLPPQRMPAVLFLDEPELGLHPSALQTICSLIYGASDHCQIFIATQNAEMLSQFAPEDVVVVSRNGRASEYQRLSSEDLAEWIGEYTLPELWERNIIGGRP